MTTDDLAMVNLHRTNAGGWSWSAYKLPHELWRTNKGVADFWLCFEELQQCLVEETVKQLASRGIADTEGVFGPELNPDACGATKSKLPVKRKRKGQSKWKGEPL